MSRVPHYVKSHGLGNVYLVIDPRDIPFELTPPRIRMICDRNTGIGSDGILVVSPPTGADFGLRIFNPDGTGAEKSGNGIRIFAKFLREHGYTDRDELTIDTPGGRVSCALERDDERVAYVTADMGRATFAGPSSIAVDGRQLDVTLVSMGNPHCVVIVPELAAVDVPRLGRAIEHHAAFPDRTNVQFAEVKSRAEVAIEIWERGAGRTMASGSSSCAVAAACHRRGLVDRDVVVSMPGGRLEITVGEAYAIRMRGAVEEISTGDFSPDLLRLLARG